MNEEIYTPKHHLLVTIETYGGHNTVECRATECTSLGHTDSWWMCETFETGADPEWNDVYDLPTALKSIDDNVDRHCNEFGSSIYQL